MTTDNIDNAEIIEEYDDRGTEKQQQTQQTQQTTGGGNGYPEGWRASTKALWNGVIFTSILILLCAIMVFFFPKEGIVKGIGPGALLVYFLILSFTALGSINTYQKGLMQFAQLFGKDGSRALDVIRWGFMIAMMGVLFHIFIFYLPFTDPEVRQEGLTLLIGNSILLLSLVTSVVGFLMLATAKGIPDASRKGSLLMIVAALVLVGAAFVAPYAILDGTTANRILELVILLLGAFLFLLSWHKIITVKL